MSTRSLQDHILAEALPGKDDASAISRLSALLAAEPDKYAELRAFASSLSIGGNTTERHAAEDVADLRLSHILLRDCRYYGQPQDRGYYGVSVSDRQSNAPLPMLVLLGSNGVGKSSVFAAVEHKATGEVGEAQLRKIKAADYLGKDNHDIKLYAESGEVSQALGDNASSLHPFFVTENSIMEQAQYMQTVSEEGDWLYFFCRLIGLSSDFIDFVFGKGKITEQLMTALEILNIESEDKDTEINILTDIIDDICLCNTLSDGEKKNMRSDKKYISALLNESSAKDAATLTAIHQRLASRSKDYKAFKEADDTIRKATSNEHGIDLHIDVDGAISTLVNRLELIAADKPDFQELLRSVDRRNALSRYSEDVTPSDYENRKQSIENIRENLRKATKGIVSKIIDQEYYERLGEMFRPFLRDGETAQFSADKDGGIRMEVYDQPVHTYFNTFRYRLFCLSCQALACVKIMKERRFRFPLLLDDVFFANDYQNRGELSHFFTQLFKAAEAMGVELQVIFLTHDEQLVATLHAECKQATFGRMVTPQLAESCEQCRRTIPGGESEYTNLYIQIYV